MAVLTKSQLHQFNRKMLGLGAPVVIDGVGYNKFDFGKMTDFADRNPDEFTDRQCWFIALTLVDEICAAFADLKLDVSELYAAKPPVEQMTLFPE